MNKRQRKKHTKKFKQRKFKDFHSTLAFIAAVKKHIEALKLKILQDQYIMGQSVLKISSS